MKREHKLSYYLTNILTMTLVANARKKLITGKIPHLMLGEEILHEILPPREKVLDAQIQENYKNIQICIII